LDFQRFQSKDLQRLAAIARLIDERSLYLITILLAADHFTVGHSGTIGGRSSQRARGKKRRDE